MDYEIIIEASDDENAVKGIFEDLLINIIKKCLSEVEDVEKGDHLSSSFH